MKKLLYSILPCVLFLTVIKLADASTSYSFTYGGITRTYHVYLPVNFTSDSSLPLVFNLHGLNENGTDQELYTSFDNLADTARCVVVYPDGINQQWNIVVGCTGNNPPCTGVDDVGFISALIDTMHKNFNIDLGRVYSCGLSDGAYMSFRLACELSWRIAAIAGVAGLLQEAYPLYPECNPARKMPVIQIHGTADSVVPYSNNPPEASVASTVSRWITINGCPSSPVVTNLPNINTADSCTVTENYYGLCGDSTLLIQYTVNGGGHTWPDAIPVPSLGHTNMDMNANGVMWNFFKRYSLPADLRFTGLAASYCSNAAAVTLTGIPSGGTFSGSGISGSQFSPASAGGGTHTITYSITTQGCTYNSTQSVSVTTNPSPGISGLNSTYCSNAAAVALTGSPSGGVFSGAGISGNQFNPQTAGTGGPYTITYSGTDGACNYTTSKMVTVDSVPHASFSGLDSAYCLSQNPGAITLTGSPAGGTFSGTGVSGSTFTPATAGAGTHAVTYVVTSGICSDTASKNTTIVASANATITGLNSSYCADANAVTLSAIPARGAFSGTGVTGNQFSPQSAGPGGPYQISYNGTLAGCSFSGSQSVTVDTVPVAAISGLDSSYCSNAAPVMLTGTPAGGTFTGPGVSANRFHPDSAGVGTHVITYSFTDNNNCTGNAQTSVKVMVCTRIGELELSVGFSVFPNPARQQFTLKTYIPGVFAVSNMLGQKIWSGYLEAGQEITIQLNEAGTYLLTLQSNDKLATQKVIVY